MSTPARSAWPGRGSVTGFVPFPCGSPSGGQGLIPHVQFLWSTVPNDERERRPERPAVPQPGEHLDLVLLDLLARRAPVALLAALQVGVDRLPVELEAGGQAGQDRDERGPVRLPCGGKAERHCARDYGPPRPRRASPPPAP